MTKRAKRGSTKQERIDSRNDKAKAKLAEEKLRAKEIIADNYHEYIEILDKVARNQLGREVSVTNQVSTIKFFLTQADEILTEINKKDKVEEDNQPIVPEEKENKVVSLMNF